jgi:hypothetical protein
MLVSSFSFVIFLAPVAFNEWPEAVISVTTLVGFILNLQFIIFGAQLCWKLVASGCVAGLDTLVTFFRFTRGLCRRLYDELLYRCLGLFTGDVNG